MIKILGIITKEKVEKVKTNKYIDSLSNDLFKENIEHLIVEDSECGIGIKMLEDLPSIMIHNDKDEQWEYYARYMENENDDEPTLMETYVLKDSNKNVSIMEFINILLKCINNEE